MKVKIKRWHGVGIWKWDVDEEVCGICRMPFEACCPGVKYPGGKQLHIDPLFYLNVDSVGLYLLDDCPPVWGKCGHAYHMQCVMKWLESQQNVRQVSLLICFLSLL
jgi:anaphase-promoting complex subunit 11